MGGEVVIKLENISKSYRIVKSDPSETGTRGAFRRKEYETHVVFKDVNLEVYKGEVVGIHGTNGCGKSTFLKIISKILKPDTGRVQVKGRIASILELSMGFHADLSGYDNIFLRSELYGIPRSEVEKHIDAIIRYADLGDYIHNPVRTYSSGMRARLAFSIMINVDADIYLVDEALSTGDAKFASKASEHLKNLVRAGKTILMVSHSMGVIENTCTRAVWLNEKTVYRDGTAEEVCAEYNRSLFEDIEDIRQLAEDGASSAQYRLACCYRDGEKTAADPAQYRYWLSEAASKQHGMAMAEFADLLMDEDPVANFEQARELYRSAADKGNFEAKRKYAALVSGAYEGLPALVDVYEKIAASGYPMEMYETGNLYYRTAVNRTAYLKAAEWFEKAVEAGSVDAAFQLGMMYREGQGVQKSVDRAVSLLEMAAEAGHPRAQTTLASMYEDGRYLPYDAVKSFKWYLRSAEGGNARSQNQVAVMYRDGIGTEANGELANMWFHRYAVNLMSDFYTDASDLLIRRDVETELTPDELTRIAAESMDNRALTSRTNRLKDPAEVYENAVGAAAVLGRGQMALAECYLNGTGVEVDKEMALALFKKVADTGNREAMYQTALLYKEGFGGEGTETMYRRYLRMAADYGHRDAKVVVSKWDARNAKRKKSAQSQEAPVTETPQESSSEHSE